MSFLCDSTGRELLEVPGFLCTSSHGPFPFADSALYPFMIICHRHEYGYILSPVRRQNESSESSESSP